MKAGKALWLAATMFTVALAGCTSSEGGELDMFVTASDDPLTQPFTFKATGPSAETYLWDFGDGITAEGKEVEHIYGFSNGDVTVKLTACTGGECNSVLRKVPLGGDANVPPAGSFVSSAEWVLVGETVTLDATSSTDANGDPILYRWTCDRVLDIEPPADGGGHAHGPPGVPFGVNARALFDDSLTGGQEHGSDLCADFALEAEQPWSQETGKITGSFAESGVYQIDVFVRDPKSAAWVGRVDIFVTDDRPEATTTHTFSGTLNAGSQGSFQQQCEAAAQGPCPTDFDRLEHTFTVPIPNTVATATFSSSTLGAQDGGARYSLKVGEGFVQSATSEETKLFGPGAFKNGYDYRVIVEIDGVSVQVDYAFELVIENDLNPRHLFQYPV